MNQLWVSQAHKLADKIHNVDLSTMDARTVGEARIIIILLLFVI